jgi:hypothetical protein
MKAASFCGTFIPIYRTTRRHVPEYPKLHILFAAVRSSNLTGVSFLPHDVQAGPDPTQPPIKLLQEVLRQDVKREELEADHTLQSNAEIKNAWSYLWTLPYFFIT